MGKHELRPASPLNLSIYVGGGRETHKDSFSNGECIRTGSVWKSGHLVLNCEIEIYYQLRCSNKPLEKSIDKGDNPVCHLQLSVQGVCSVSCPINQCQHAIEDKSRHMVAWPWLGEHVYPTRLCAARWLHGSIRPVLEHG